MEEVAISSTQPANPVKDASAHLIGIDKVQNTMAEPHWLAIGKKNPSKASSVARAVTNGILFRIVVSIVGRQKI